MSRWCVYEWLRREHLAAEKTGPKQAWKLDMEALAAHVAAYPDAYQYERAEALGVSRHVVLYGLKRLGIKNFVYREKDDDRRSLYLKQLASIPENKRVYVDESGFDAPLIREYGYAKREQSVWGERSGKRFARTSLIAGVKNNKPFNSHFLATNSNPKTFRFC